MYYVLPFVAANVKVNDMKVEIKDDKPLVKFGDLSKGDVFVYDGVPYVKAGNRVSTYSWMAHKLGETFGGDFDKSTMVHKAKKVTIEI